MQTSLVLWGTFYIILKQLVIFFFNLICFLSSLKIYNRIRGFFKKSFFGHSKPLHTYLKKAQPIFFNDLHNLDFWVLSSKFIF